MLPACANAAWIDAAQALDIVPLRSARTAAPALRFNARTAAAM